MHIIINNNLISVSISNAFNNLIYDANHEQIERQIVHKPVHNKLFFFAIRMYFLKNYRKPKT